MEKNNIKSHQNMYSNRSVNDILKDDFPGASNKMLLSIIEYGVKNVKDLLDNSFIKWLTYTEWLNEDVSRKIYAEDDIVTSIQAYIDIFDSPVQRIRLTPQKPIRCKFSHIESIRTFFENYEVNIEDDDKNDVRDKLLQFFDFHNAYKYFGSYPLERFINQLDVEEFLDDMLDIIKTHSKNKRNQNSDEDEC